MTLQYLGLRQFLEEVYAKKYKWTNRAQKIFRKRVYLPFFAKKL